MRSGVNIRGNLVLRLINRAGGVRVERHSNLVVLGPRVAFAQSIGGGGAVREVVAVAFGRGTTPPALSDSAVQDELLIKSFDRVTFPAGGLVQFDWSIDYTELNGEGISEWCLLDDQDNLFARIVRAPIAKTAALRIEGAWTIDFTQ